MNEKIKLEIPKDLASDIQNYGNEIAKKIAIGARDELTFTYAKAIEYFYDDYDPIVYSRKWQLNNSYKKYYTNSHGTIYYGGVCITTENMKDVHQDSNEVVLELALGGWHGNPNRHIYTFPEPLNVVYDKRNLILDNIQLLAIDAIKEAKTSRSYNLLFK